jgi:predicted RNA binding protein YcfA (HicA-like mRNA interferase family)
MFNVIQILIKYLELKSMFLCIVCNNNGMNSRDIMARLKAEGWILVNVRGSHHNYRHPAGKGRVTVPHPKKDLPKGTVRSIFNQAGWDWPPN